MNCFVLYTLLLISCFGLTNSKLDQKLKIIFRYDDYLLTSSEFYDLLLNTFKKNGIPLCLGIIPYDRNGKVHSELNNSQLMDLCERIENGDIEIALHGYNHYNNELRRRSFFINHVPSEFAGLDYHDQFTRISKAKKTLDSLLKINVTVFIPPYNTYDANTLKVLDSLKFEAISASLDGISSSETLSYIPATIDDLDELLGVINKNLNQNHTIVVMMHSYSFIGGSNYNGSSSKRIDLFQLDTMLKWIKNQKNISSTTFQILGENELFDYKRFIENSVNNNAIIKILNKIKIYQNGVFYTAEYSSKLKQVFIIFNIFLHTLVFLFFYFMSCNIVVKFKPSKILIIVYMTTMVILFFIILYNRINSNSLMVFAVFMLTILSSTYLGIKRGTILHTK